MRLKLLSFLFTVVLSIGACSDKSSNGPPRKIPRTTATPNVKIIHFFTTESDPEQIKTLESLSSEYETLNPGIQVDIILATPANRERRLLTALASGGDLGIFEIEPTLMTEWVESGYLLELDEVAEAIGIQDYQEGSLFRQQGHIYAIPYATSVYGLWVRHDLLEQAGLSLPTTYEELLHAADVLTQGETYGIAFPAGQNIATVNYFSIILWQTGGDYFDCQGNVVFDQPEAFEAIQKWASLTQYAPPGFTTWGFGEQVEGFTQENIAMVIYAGRLGVNLAEQAPDLAEDVSVIFPPLGDTKVTLGVWSRFAIAAGTEHPEEAKAFLQWLLSGDRLLRFDLTVPGHMIPPLQSVQALTLDIDNTYITQHTDWVQKFYDWLPFASHPAMNMGVIRNGQFTLSAEAPPWANTVFGASGIIVNMLQKISLESQPSEEAWREATVELKTTVELWKRQHPDWRPATCS